MNLHHRNLAVKFSCFTDVEGGEMSQWETDLFDSAFSSSPHFFSDSGIAFGSYSSQSFFWSFMVSMKRL